MVNEVVTLMVGDGFEAINRCDVVIVQQVGPFLRIFELHVGYMALHYPLLFLYSEDGWHSNIPLNDVVLQAVDADLGEDHVEEFDHRKHHNVTMVEFYGYQLQHRDTNGIVLFWGD
jgi:hypothetical protein